MGAFLDKPKTEKFSDQGKGNGLQYGLSSMQGWRIEMEDAHCAETELSEKLNNWSLFAVLDGHAGSATSVQASKWLKGAILETSQFKALEEDQSMPEEKVIELVKEGVREGFLQLDAKLKDMEDVRNGEDKSGTTVVLALLSPTHIFIANCGDSRAVLSSDGKTAFHSQDHKPSCEKEKERIENAGGSVMIQRVNGSLAVSRALGDFEYKQVANKGPCEQLVSPEPEITMLKRSEKDEFLILACDGIWDVVSNDQLADYIRFNMNVTDDLKSICDSVVDFCLNKGSRDNMSIVLVALPNSPKPTEEAKTREKELEERIREKVKEVLDQSEEKGNDIDLSMVMRRIGDQDDLEGLPPGAGLAAKQNFIDEVFRKLNPEADHGDQ